MDARVTELHCIMPIANIPSVMKHGILPYERAAKLAHRSVAMQPVQDKRDQKHVPGGLKLHQYANLYFHARNPMLYIRKNESSNLSVLRVSTEVLRVAGAIITDQNATSDYVRFLAPAQWKLLDFDSIFAMDWRHPDDQIAYWRHKAQKCAEVLVPNRVEARFVVGAYVADRAAASQVERLALGLSVEVNPVLFFR
jgi:ssDNA thymidine ADP-ribosyltransferase, DarT